jgi:hypothetical protein
MEVILGTVIRGETLNTMALVRVTGRSPENGCQYRETHRWATGPIVYMGDRSSWSEIMYNISNTTAGPGKMHDVCKRYRECSAVRTVRFLNFVTSVGRVTGGSWVEIYT